MNLESLLLLVHVAFGSFFFVYVFIFVYYFLFGRCNLHAKLFDANDNVAKSLVSFVVDDVLWGTLDPLGDMG